MSYRPSALKLSLSVALISTVLESASAFCANSLPSTADSSNPGSIEQELLASSAVIYNGTNLCAATVLNERWLLTAAHCADIGVNATVRAAHKKRDGPPDARVAQFIPHPNHTRSSILNDIALVEVDSCLKGTQNVSLHIGGIPEDGTFTYVTGYGRMNTTFSVTAFDTFRYAELPVYGITACNHSLENAGLKMEEGFKETNFVCTGKLYAKSCNEDVCIGDSGGPLYVAGSSGNLVQIGVTLTSPKCDITSIPGVYTAVSKHAEWIAATVDGEVNLVNAYEDLTEKMKWSIFSSPEPKVPRNPDQKGEQEGTNGTHETSVSPKPANIPGSNSTAGVPESGAASGDEPFIDERGRPIDSPETPAPGPYNGEPVIRGLNFGGLVPWVIVAAVLGSLVAAVVAFFAIRAFVQAVAPVSPSTAAPHVEIETLAPIELAEAQLGP